MSEGSIIFIRGPCNIKSHTRLDGKRQEENKKSMRNDYMLSQTPTSTKQLAETERERKAGLPPDYMVPSSKFLIVHSPVFPVNEQVRVVITIMSLPPPPQLNHNAMM